MGRIEISLDMEPIVKSYYENNAKKMHEMVDKILLRLHFVDVDKNDFYSLANEIFMYAVRDFNKLQSFDGFLYSCLYKKFCTEMTSRTREKRCTKKKIEEKNVEGETIEKIVIIPDLSLYTPIGDDENSTVGEMIADEITIEKELFEKKEDGYSEKMLTYLNRLSTLQKEVLKLDIAGYLPNEIRKELHISEKEYADCYAAIHSYRNVSVLF